MDKQAEPRVRRPAGGDVPRVLESMAPRSTSWRLDRRAVLNQSSERPSSVELDRREQTAKPLLSRHIQRCSMLAESAESVPGVQADSSVASPWPALCARRGRRKPKAWWLRGRVCRGSSPDSSISCALDDVRAGLADEGEELLVPLEPIAHRGACGKTRVGPKNRRSGPEAAASQIRVRPRRERRGCDPTLRTSDRS
jgi:hypothetical protein